ncbi:MAG TPA: hypothetical protein VF756_22255 [Thermoanaerobaculia bacterium]
MSRSPGLRRQPAALPELRRLLDLNLAYLHAGAVVALAHFTVVGACGCAPFRP